MNLHSCVAAIALAGTLAAGEVTIPRVLHPDLEIELVLHEPEIATPIALDTDGRGRVWAIESNTHFQTPGYRRHATDRILIVEATAGGPAGRVTVFADGLHQTMAIALRRDAAPGRALHLATRRDVRLLEDMDGDDRADRTTFLARLETREDYPHNGLSGFARDDLGWIYFAIGENMGVPYRLTAADGVVVSGGPEGGSIFRLRPDGSGLERWAVGFWNTFHLAFDAFGRLFAVDNDPDSRPPCRLLHIVRDGDYGYRRWLGRKGLHPFTAWNGELAGTLPMVAGTGEAPSGVLACEEAGLPAAFQGRLLVTSWGDHRLELYNLEARGASVASRPEVVVQGGEDFRPVGIAVAPGGAVYFSDWVKQDYPVHGHGRIWRLRRKEGAPAITTLPAAGSPRARYAALAARARESGLAGEALAGALADPAPELRAAAVRLAAGSGAGPPGALLASLLDDPAPAVRLEALLACGRGSRSETERLLPRLEALLADGDPFLAAAAADAAVRLGGTSRLLEQAARLDAARDAPRLRLGLLVALRRSGEPAARTALPGFLADPDPEVRRAALAWVGLEKLAEHRAALETALAAGPVPRPLFDAYLAARGLVAGDSPEARDAVERDDFLAVLALDRSRPVELRALALRAAAPSHPRLDEKAYRLLLAAGGEDALPLRLEAARSLRESALAAAPALLEAAAAEAGAPLALRREAVAGLARFLPATEAALRRLLAGGEGPLGREAERALRLGGIAPAPGAASGPPAASAGAVPGTTASGTAASGNGGAGTGAARTTAPARLDPAALLEGGDPVEGEAIFFHPAGPRCSGCHTVRGRGAEVGPDLSRAGEMPRARLLESLLEPAKEIAPRYMTWIIRTDDAVLAGLLTAEDPGGGLVLTGGDGRSERLAAGAIRGREPAPTSIMPENLLDLLTPSEARDLLAFLSGLR